MGEILTAANSVVHADPRLVYFRVTKQKTRRERGKSLKPLQGPRRRREETSVNVHAMSALYASTVTGFARRRAMFAGLL